MARVGRPQKPYQSRYGPIPGLARDRNGRWRILATGERFRQPDEDKAISYFRERTHSDNRVLFIPPAERAIADEQRDDEVIDTVLAGPNTDRTLAGAFGQAVPMRSLWPFLRRLFRTHPDWVAEQMHMPRLAAFLKDNLAPSEVSIDQVIEAYRRFSTATAKSQREALGPFRRLVKFTRARFLSDLTERKLLEFREHVVEDARLKSSGTITAYFSRIRNVLKIASRSNLDVEQINVLLTRCRAKLFSPVSNVLDNPQPISRENFSKLLETARTTGVPETWRAMLLLALNAALYMNDLCSLKWSMLDLKKQTLISRRSKRGNCLRVATLWAETIEAVRALPHHGSCPYVFVSNRGTRYNRNTKINDFRDLCKKAGISGVKFSHLRDGAYTSACSAPGVEERFARLLAGHKAPGLQDKYVLRNPAIVRPACQAVYQAYAPFPKAVLAGAPQRPARDL